VNNYVQVQNDALTTRHYYNIISGTQHRRRAANNIIAGLELGRIDTWVVFFRLVVAHALPRYDILRAVIIA